MEFPAPDAVRPRLLYLCQQNPWRLSGGGLIRNYWIARALTERFDVDLVTADDREDPPAAYASRFHSIASFPRARGRIGQVARGIAALRPTASLHTTGSVTKALRDHVARESVRAPYAGAIFDMNMVEALPSGVPAIYHAHNCETALLRRRVAIEPLPARLVVASDVVRLGAIESRVLRRARLTVACSRADVADLAEMAPNVAQRCVVVPNGVDVAGYAKVRAFPRTGRVVLITGRYDWRPNQLGLDWFCSDVLPALRTALAGRELVVRVAGGMHEEYARKIASFPGMVAVANPLDMADELRGASVVVAPIIASSGTRLRILEAWASARPVVTTEEGAFGLDYTAGTDLIVRDKADPRGFANEIVRLLDDPSEGDRLARAGLARSHEYDWPVLGGGLVSALASALA